MNRRPHLRRRGLGSSRRTGPPQVIGGPSHDLSRRHRPRRTRPLDGLGLPTCVGAVSKMFKPSGDRVKTDKRDAAFLSRMLAVGNAVERLCPTPGQEAARELAGFVWALANCEGRQPPGRRQRRAMGRTADRLCAALGPRAVLEKRAPRAGWIGMRLDARMSDWSSLKPAGSPPRRRPGSDTDIERPPPPAKHGRGRIWLLTG